MSFYSRVRRSLVRGFLLRFALQAANAHAQADVIAATEYLSAVEKEIFREVNLVRTQPAKYAEFVAQMKAYYDDKLFTRPNEEAVLTEEGVAAVEEAVRFLRKAKPVSPLSPSRGLSLAARDHVAEQGPRGAIGHRSRGGGSIADRLQRYGSWQIAFAENISYGESQARMIVAVWIIDDGVRGRGHRENLFNADYKTAGVAFGGHKAFKSMCVVDFAASYQEKNN